VPSTNTERSFRPLRVQDGVRLVIAETMIERESIKMARGSYRGSSEWSGSRELPSGTGRSWIKTGRARGGPELRDQGAGVADQATEPEVRRRGARPVRTELV